jgi:alkyl sulfatase BDS1-like metallo-beta-lactamase superfamily hydrolase
MTPQEIAEVVKLPPALDAEHPWGRQYYGTVKHSTRNVYGGYVGWFQGDPVELDPTPRAEQARHYVQLMGGRDRVLNEARRAFKAGKNQQAAELATLLLRINIDDEEPRRLKAAAFRKLGYAQMNASWRNYYLVSAMDLDQQVPEAIYVHEAVKVLGPALRGLPAANQMASLPTRLRAEDTLDKDFIAAVRYTDEDAVFRLHLRHGVLEVSPLTPTGAKFVLNVTRIAMGDLLAGVDPASLLGSAIIVDGDAKLAAEFLGYFDRAFQHRPEVVVR